MHRNSLLTCFLVLSGVQMGFCMAQGWPQSSTLCALCMLTEPLVLCQLLLLLMLLLALMLLLLLHGMQAGQVGRKALTLCFSDALLVRLLALQQLLL